MAECKEREYYKELYECAKKEFDKNPEEFIISEILYSLILSSDVSEKIQLLTFLSNLPAVSKQVKD